MSDWRGELWRAIEAWRAAEAEVVNCAASHVASTAKAFHAAVARVEAIALAACDPEVDDPPPCVACGGSESLCNCECGNNYCGCACHLAAERKAIGK